MFLFFILDMPYLVNTTAWSTLTSSNPTYIRPSGSNMSYYYDKFDVVASSTGTYTFGTNSALDTFGSIYYGPFKPNYSHWNLMKSDDDSGGNSQFRFEVHLEAYMRYTLVITTYNPSYFGAYTIIVSGIDSVSLVRKTVTGSTLTSSTIGYNYTIAQTSQ